MGLSNCPKNKISRKLLLPLLAALSTTLDQFYPVSSKDVIYIYEYKELRKESQQRRILKRCLDIWSKLDTKILRDDDNQTISHNYPQEMPIAIFYTYLRRLSHFLLRDYAHRCQSQNNLWHPQKITLRF